MLVVCVVDAPRVPSLALVDQILGNSVSCAADNVVVVGPRSRREPLLSGDFDKPVAPDEAGVLEGNRAGRQLEGFEMQAALNIRDVPVDDEES